MARNQVGSKTVATAIGEVKKLQRELGKREQEKFHHNLTATRFRNPDCKGVLHSS